MPDGAPIPAFVNPDAGSAADGRAAVAADPRFALREVRLDARADALHADAARGTPRVLVAGGDGTITFAARALAGTRTALAVLPGGTLNHFARDLGLPPGDPAACLEAAVRGAPRPVDAATVNGELFLGTSSVGAYVRFVHARERLEGYGLGYRIASALASAWIWLRLRAFTVVVRAGERPGDAERRYRTPLVFVAVGERAMTVGERGGRLPGGARRLQLLVLDTQSRWQVIALAARLAAAGPDAADAGAGLDVSLVDACEIELRRPWGRVSTDGELTPMRAPLHYRMARGALLAVAPPADLAAGPFAAGAPDDPPVDTA
ncbi:diacylglycerol kinase family protein [Roseisolibacter sp. H3M3-2]|uniref:diacylglycerol/lipid kinase family protein n=1 Tax=Roseisolibacter sp. H3M3-2 TaxID=3031323 RepID=UPI0023DA5EAA|nr:diacylglycerol kinase family protein [Roseisolibacter sp. H3M3-2]MDF1503375.1 diacylglycerol kinase family protein [Roseisolibacter sp. H3M3-2]